MEPGETPTEACVREIKEELGLGRTVGALLVVDWSPSRNEGDKVLFIFDGGVIDEDGHAQLELESAELSDVRYFDRAERAAVLNERLTRRVSAALDAKADQQSRYLEHGHPHGIDA